MMVWFNSAPFIFINSLAIRIELIDTKAHLPFLCNVIKRMEQVGLRNSYQPSLPSSSNTHSI